jgi:cytochrome c556
MPDFRISPKKQGVSMKFKNIIIASLAIGLTSTAMAQAKPEDLIKSRQAGYQFISWNMGRLKANTEGTFNKDQVIQAANAIQAIANSGMGALFAPGTEKGIGFHETAVKPELFQPEKKARLTEVATAFNKEANEMAKVAATGDVAAIKQQFGELGKSCKGCHDDFRKKKE